VVDRGRADGWAWGRDGLYESISNSQPSVPWGDSRRTSDCTPSSTVWPTASSRRAGQVSLYVRRASDEVAAPTHAALLGDDFNGEPAVGLRVSTFPPQIVDFHRWLVPEEPRLVKSCALLVLSHIPA
jgi:hypothetical protein